jgi:hypothetical protein
MTYDPDDLSPEEGSELAALPRERVPGRLLEERVVRALRARGVLHRRRPPMAWLAAGLAASLAVFAGGFAAGQWATSRQLGNALVSAQDATARQAAETVQRTGSAYLTALAALARYADHPDAEAVQQGREAAFAALAAAAGELVTLAPDDPVARAIESVLASAHRPAVQPGRARAVLWF